MKDLGKKKKDDVMEKPQREESCIMVTSSYRRKTKQRSKISFLWLVSSRADVGTQHFTSTRKQVSSNSSC